MTNWGKKRREKKRRLRNEEIREMARAIANEKRDEAKSAAQKIIDANSAKIETSFNAINTHLNNVDKQLADMMLINAEQTKTIEHMDEKIDTNEIDRLRWEIISTWVLVRARIAQSRHSPADFKNTIICSGEYSKNFTRPPLPLIATDVSGGEASESSVRAKSKISLWFR